MFVFFLPRVVDQNVHNVIPILTLLSSRLFWRKVCRFVSDKMPQIDAQKVENMKQLNIFDTFDDFLCESRKISFINMFGRVNCLDETTSTVALLMKIFCTFLGRTIFQKDPSYQCKIHKCFKFEVFL